MEGGISNTTPSASAAAPSATSSGSKEDIPRIGGSFWTFLGIVIGAAVFLTVVAGIGFLILRHNRRRRITRRAGRGDNLFASHPTPFVPGQRRFALLRDSAGPDLNENDPFVATSPRVSGTFGGYGRGAESHGSSGYDYDDVAADGGPTHETDAAFGGYSRYAGYDDAYNSYDVHGLPSGAGEAHAGQGGQHTISHTAQSSMVTATNTIADEPKMPEPRVPGT